MSEASAAPTMRAVEVRFAGGPFELVERPLPEPGPRQVRIRVEACGVCHSDASAKQGGMPQQVYPMVPGHEIAGVIEAVGADIVGWAVGQRVGAGWFAGHCGHCDSCRRGRFMSCRNMAIHGVTRDGGYAEAVIADADALALIPDDLASVDAAPMLCAGVTIQRARSLCGAPRQRRGRGRRWRPRPFGHPVRREDGLQDGRDLAQPGQGQSRQNAGRAALHRQRQGRRRGDAAGSGRRRCDRGDRGGRRRPGRGDQRPDPGRQAGDAGRPGRAGSGLCLPGARAAAP